MTTANKRILLAGGGTAGHVNPLLAVADAIKKRDPNAEVIALGTAVGLEANLVPQAGYELETIEKVPFPRSPNLDALRFPFRWKRETGKVRDIIKQRGTQVVVGFGGYASAPAYAAAHKLGVPVVIHEQNARAGMANKLGAKWASYIGTAYEGSGLKPAEGASMERVGLPLRPAIANLAARMESNPQKVREEEAKALGLNPNRPIIVVTGGSLGAQSLNRAIAQSAKTLLRYAQIVHLTGKGKIDEVREEVSKNAGADVFTGLGEDAQPTRDYHAAQYLERIDHAFGCADLVICRSGAGTVSELTALGIPAIYVPLPIGNGEQRFNAQPVVDANGGLMVADSEFTAEWIKEHIPQIMKDPNTLLDYGHNAWGYGIRDAADAMAVKILELAER